MKLRIQAIRISLSTNRGPHGVTARFTDGLNVIRAENTSGKSALINGMLYALGLEILAGKRGVEAMKPVLRSDGEYGGEEFHVVESFVEIEIGNCAGEVVTIRRFIAGERDCRLVEVVHGEVITNDTAEPRQVDTFFVGIEGAAQRERGFHRFLAEFLRLDLPYVKRFRGEDVPLYIECVAPLMLIEQIRGWSGIQATLPQSYGIRNVARLSIEYLLDLDVMENEKKRILILEEANSIKEGWGALRSSMMHVCSQIGGRLMNVPANPVASLTDEPWISVFGVDDEALSLPELLVAKRTQLLEFSQWTSAGTPEAIEMEAVLDAKETHLLFEQAALSQIQTDIHAQEFELHKLEDRLEFLNADIQRNKDIKRLRDFGADIGMAVIQDRCPTCNQSIQDSLIPIEGVVMDIKENIAFLTTEAEAVHLLISAGRERLSRLQGLKNGKSNAVSNLRSMIRDLRSDLLQSRDLSIATIREQIHLQEEVCRLEQLRDEFDMLVDKLRGLANEWQENRSRHVELPDDYFSATDREKINALSRRFGNIVRRFGYRSTGISRLHISDDNYRPVCDDFDILAGASASDNIRVIWAYTLALLQVSKSYNCNHWGLIVFDEPEQQQMKQTSSDELYLEIGQMPPQDFQVIVATSAPADFTNQRLFGLPHNLLEFGEKVIRPL